MKARIIGTGPYIGLVPDQVAEVLSVKEDGSLELDVVYLDGKKHSKSKGLIFFKHEYEVVEE